MICNSGYSWTLSYYSEPLTERNSLSSSQEFKLTQKVKAMAMRPRASSQPGKLSFSQSPKVASTLRARTVSSCSGSMLEEELSCPVCCEIFKDPVVLKCSHSFCRACLQEFWNKRKVRRECPTCRRKCSLTEPTISLALKNVADTFGEVIKLFCFDDFEVLCCVCQTSKKHLSHRVCPLEEGAQDLKVMRSRSLTTWETL